jgi:6-phosphogluconolactonase
MGKKITGYIGTYTELGKQNCSKGIYAFTLDVEDGGVTGIRLAAESRNPSYLAMGPSKTLFLAVNELDESRGNGLVSAFRRDPQSGNLELINQVSSEGSNPCHVSLNEKETHAVVANYTGGSIAVLPIEKEGALGKAVQVIRFSGAGPNAERQEGPHAHFFLFNKTYDRGFAFDLGTDRLMAYTFDAEAAEPLIQAASPWLNSKPGAGPRHGVFDPTGTHWYVINELDSTVDVLRYYRTTGNFEKLQNISALPEEGAGSNSSAAAIKISVDGNFVYASNRGHNSITVFKRDTVRGLLSFVDSVPSGGKTPRDFALDPSGNFLLVCHQDSDSLGVFRIDRGSGKLTQAAEYSIPAPVCVIYTSV